jgi:parvulin-like peptidyl-prolyl isomerase
MSLFDETVFDLKAGEYTGNLKSSLGFYIFKVTALKAAGFGVF